MMKQYVFEVIEEAAKQRSRDDKVKVLKSNETWALKDIIRGSMDSKVEWNLPEGSPPYQASAAHNHPTNLLRENSKFIFTRALSDYLQIIQKWGQKMSISTEMLSDFNIKDILKNIPQRLYLKFSHE